MPDTTALDAPQPTARVPDAPPLSTLTGVAVNIAALFEPAKGSIPGPGRLHSNWRAVRAVGKGCELLLDSFTDACCAFVRRTDGSTTVLQLAEVEGFELAAAGGWLIKGQDPDTPIYWIPVTPSLRSLDSQGHVRAERAAPLESADLHQGVATVTLAAAAAGSVTDLVLWQLPPAVADELRSPSRLECQPAYLWGSHTRFGKASDLYIHLTHGIVYENRYAWPFKVRVCSENDAHAIFVQLTGLRRATGRQMPGLLAQQVLQSVVGRIGPDGAYRHGVWTDQMESHYRLHCSAMHLMMDALAEAPDAAVLKALGAAAGFMAAQHERIASGVWFFHDDLEHSEPLLKRSPFKWVPSTALGKRPSNMLVLNTQLDTTIALHRYAEVTGDKQYASLVTSARDAMRSVLALRTAEPLYRLLFRWIGLTFLPTERAERLPVWQRALKRLAWKHLIPRLPDIKARYPRLVMPGGYIDRELTLRAWAHDYHAINVMDLARYLRRFDDAVVRDVLLQGLEFARSSGILKRWRELPYQSYALGFWAEALYHVCTLLPDAKYRAWLADAMLDLEDLKMGQPPSLLGANAEAVPVASQLPCPSPADARLRVANLGRQGAPELLVINPTDEELALAWELPPSANLRWLRPDGSEFVDDCTLAPRSWAWARPAH